MLKDSLIILAAGKSSRMKGAHKLLLSIDGVSLINRILQQSLMLPDVEVVVVVGNRKEEVLSSICNYDNIYIVESDDASLGIGSSVSSGVAALSENIRSIGVVPADMPYLMSHHIKSTFQRLQPGENSIIRPICYDSKKIGHPVIFDATYRADLEKLRGDYVGKDLIKKYQCCVKYLHTKDSAYFVDIDSPEDWKSCLNDYKHRIKNLN